MKDYVLNEKPEPPSNDMVWAFDLGKGSIGEAVRRGNEFLHKASLLIPAEFAETKTAAGRRRMWRTRLAHKAREQWLEKVMRDAGIEVLKGRQVEKVDAEGKIIPQDEWKKKKGSWHPAPETPEEKAKRELLEREFAKQGDPTCYTSSLLRIKLLRGEKPEHSWQVFKAFHSAIQKRGYGKVPWAAREQRRAGKTEEQIEKEQAKKDPAYQAALDAWKYFKQAIQKQKLEFFEKLQPSKEERAKRNLPADYYFVPPCFYDSAKMGLWSLEHPEHLGIWNSNGDVSLPPHGSLKTTCHAQSTRNVRFDRHDVEGEIGLLAKRAAKFYPALAGKADYLLYGPAGEPYASYNPELREKFKLREGGENDWQGVLGQKIPRFDNRIIEKCALIPRLNVCQAGACSLAKDGGPDPDSLLHTEVAFLMKLKNVRVLRDGKVEPLTAAQIKTLLERKRAELSRLAQNNEDGKYSERVAEVFAFGKKKWAGVGTESEFNFRSYANHEEIEAPKCGGRSRFSRPALKIMRELILSGQAPSVFHARLMNREPELLSKMPTKVKENGRSVIRPLPIFEDSTDKNINAKNRTKGLLNSDLEFLKKMRKAGAENDSWDDIFIPNEKLDGLVLRIQAESDAANQRQKRDEAIQKLIGSQNDPIVRHRLHFFWKRLQTLENKLGEPARIVLEFAREDFLGKKAKKRWQDFNRQKRDKNIEAGKLAVNEREQLKIKLWQDQGGECVYGKEVTKDAHCVYTQRALPQPGTDDFEKKLEIDHIVPRDMGGPNAYVNYVLTFGEVANQEKKDRIPYVWFDQDRHKMLAGYIRFVQSKKESLGKKKVALLTRPDAAELVERYTALAQTAWIARLAQTIVRLHFSWPLDHQKGQERVLTLTGGQTAQFRIEFRLNSLLGENAKVSVTVADISKKEEQNIAAKIQDDLMKEMTKNRVDPRHHALDAMVLTLIPEWRHYEAKKWAKWRGQYLDEKRQREILERPTPLFDFYAEKRDNKTFLNKNSVRQLFAKMLAETDAHSVAFQHPALEETHYDRTIQQIEVAASKSLDEIACDFIEDPARRQLDMEKLQRWAKRCLDEKQKKALVEFLAHSPSLEAWDVFKKQNKSLFRGGKVKVLDSKPVLQYTIRKELRLLAYENNPTKTEKIFKPEWLREDVDQIDIATPAMREIKEAIATYLAGHSDPAQKDFLEWLKPRCANLPKKKIVLTPEADETEEPDSKRRGRSVEPMNLGCRPLQLVFKPERLLKTYVKICDPLIRSALASEFIKKGVGGKAECRSFSREEWESFCHNFRKPCKSGASGPRVIKVTLLAGDADEDTDAAEGSPEVANGEQISVSQDEFVESTKSPGAFLKGKAHKGYYLYLDRIGNWQRLPVYAHQSIFDGKKRFAEIQKREESIAGSKFREVGFFQTGCLVRLKKTLPATAKKDKEGKVLHWRLLDPGVAPPDATKINVGKFRLNTLNKLGQMKLTAQNGTLIIGSVQHFIAAELERVSDDEL